MNHTPVPGSDGPAEACLAAPGGSVADTLARMNTPAARRIDSLVTAGEIAREVEHAIKNPLATMVLAVGRIERSIDADGAPGGLTTAVKHLKEAVGTLGAAMERYRDASSWVQLDMHEVDLAGVLDAVARVAGQTTGADVRVEIHGELPGVRLDLDSMRRALLGLIWLASGDGPAGTRVEISAARDPAAGGPVVIRIGGGDPVAYDERLLRPFKHLTPGRFDLGLARWIVELHHGSLLVAESHGRIAARVTLPSAASGRRPPEGRT
jgi:nitrogen fixation/metabolism regulation signal transduction histidine kinase